MKSKRQNIEHKFASWLTDSRSLKNIFSVALLTISTGCASGPVAKSGASTLQLQSLMQKIESDSSKLIPALAGPETGADFVLLRSSSGKGFRLYVFDTVPCIERNRFSTILQSMGYTQVPPGLPTEIGPPQLRAIYTKPTQNGELRFNADFSTNSASKAFCLKALFAPAPV